MSDRLGQLQAARAMRHQPFDTQRLLDAIHAEILPWDCETKTRYAARSAAAKYIAATAADPDVTLQQWWNAVAVEGATSLQPQDNRKGPERKAAIKALVLGRLVQPTWALISTVQIEPWVRRLPSDDPLAIAHRQLREVFDQLPWVRPEAAHRGSDAGLRFDAGPRLRPARADQ